jgi:hypothetical protein
MDADMYGLDTIKKLNDSAAEIYNNCNTGTPVLSRPISQSRCTTTGLRRTIECDNHQYNIGRKDNPNPSSS